MGDAEPFEQGAPLEPVVAVAAYVDSFTPEVGDFADDEPASRDGGEAPVRRVGQGPSRGFGPSISGVVELCGQVLGGGLDLGYAAELYRRHVAESEPSPSRVISSVELVPALLLAEDFGIVPNDPLLAPCDDYPYEPGEFRETGRSPVGFRHWHTNSEARQVWEVERVVMLQDGPEDRATNQAVTEAGLFRGVTGCSSHPGHDVLARRASAVAYELSYHVPSLDIRPHGIGSHVVSPQRVIRQSVEPLPRDRTCATGLVWTYLE